MPDVILSPQTTWTAWSILGAAFFAMVVVNIIPPLAHPFNLFFTMIHEIGHVFATGLTKGEILRFSIDSNDSGVAWRRGGDNVLIGSAGYMGTTLFSASLMFLSALPDLAAHSLGIGGGLLTLVVLAYGNQSLTTLMIGCGFGLIAIGVAWLTPLWLSLFVLNFLALQGGITALRHISALSRNLSGNDDASKLAQNVGCSPMLWVRLWFVGSLFILGPMFWFVWLRGIF